MVYDILLDGVKRGTIKAANPWQACWYWLLSFPRKKAPMFNAITAVESDTAAEPKNERAE